MHQSENQPGVQAFATFDFALILGFLGHELDGHSLPTRLVRRQRGCEVDHRGLGAVLGARVQLVAAAEPPHGAHRVANVFIGTTLRKLR